MPAASETLRSPPHPNANSLPWLLDPADPSVRYRTLTDLLDRPATDP